MPKKNRRPANLPYPNEWLTFKALSEDGETTKQYRIRDLMPKRYEEAVSHMTRYFLADEPLSQSRQLRQHPLSIYEFQDIIRSTLLENKMTIACFCDGKIVGINMLCVNKQGEKIEPQDFRCPQINHIRTTSDFILGQVNVYKHYNVGKYVTSLGISVSQEYRNRGIAQKLLEAQELVAKSFGIHLCSGLFTSEFLQKCADNLKYDNNYEISYEQLAAKGNAFSYPNISNRNIQVRSQFI